MKLASFFGISVEQMSGEKTVARVTTEQRLKRALDDLAIAYSEIKSLKTMKGNRDE
jgi:hypothetical protein